MFGETNVLNIRFWPILACGKKKKSENYQNQKKIVIGNFIAGEWRRVARGDLTPILKLLIIDRQLDVSKEETNCTAKFFTYPSPPFLYPPQ